MRKSILLGSVVALALSACANSSNTGLAKIQETNMQVNFAPMKSVKWDGINIPKGQQCKYYGATNPTTPALKISNIPQQALQA